MIFALVWFIAGCYFWYRVILRIVKQKVKK